MPKIPKQAEAKLSKVIGEATIKRIFFVIFLNSCPIDYTALVVRKEVRIT